MDASSSSSRSHSAMIAAADTILLQPVLSWTSSFVVPMALMSRLTQYIHLCFGLPLFLFPGGTICRVFLPTYCWSRLFTCIAFMHLSVMFSTFSLSMMSSFLTWSLSGLMPICTSSFHFRSYGRVETHYRMCRRSKTVAD